MQGTEGLRLGCGRDCGGLGCGRHDSEAGDWKSWVGSGTLAELQALSAESALVNLAFIGP